MHIRNDFLGKVESSDPDTQLLNADIEWGKTQLYNTDVGKTKWCHRKGAADVDSSSSERDLSSFIL